MFPLFCFLCLFYVCLVFCKTETKNMFVFTFFFKTISKQKYGGCGGGGGGGSSGRGGGGDGGGVGCEGDDFVNKTKTHFCCFHCCQI